MADDAPVDRRGFLKVVGTASAASAAVATPIGAAVAQAPHQGHQMPAASAAQAADRLSGWAFFNSDEVDFVKAALDTIIPPDSTGPSATEAGCATYMDRQMAGAFGRGAKLYLQGPFGQTPTPQQGYQLPLTPSELIRIGIADVNAHALRTKQKFFKDLAPADRAAILTDVEANRATLANVPGAAWFNLFLNLTMEGYFGDPMYGGNKDKSVWKMIGFPGVPGVYSEVIEQYRNKPYPHTPRSIQDFA